MVVESVRYAMVAIDNFTKIAEVIPIESRQPIELISALKLIFKSHEQETLNNSGQLQKCARSRRGG